MVTFHRLDDATTRVTLQLDHDPEGFVEKAGDALGIIGHRVKGDLKTEQAPLLNDQLSAAVDTRGRATPSTSRSHVSG